MDWGSCGPSCWRRWRSGERAHRPPACVGSSRGFPPSATALGRTVGDVDTAACVTALEAAIELYTELREAGGQGSEVEMSEVEREVRAHAAGLPVRLGRPGPGS